MTLIAPSILAADFSNLEREVRAIEAAGADMLHIDVMDGHFVPNLTFGPEIIRSIKNHTSLPLDVHLMIEYPEKFIDKYCDSGADIITIHPETTKHLHKTISMIKELGCKAGIALLPTTSVNVLDYMLDIIDYILVMSVNPGFGGQLFMHNQLIKISTLSKMIAERNIIIAVDGGINESTAQMCVESGANMLISGSYIFSGDYKDRINSLRYSRL